MRGIVFIGLLLFILVEPLWARDKSRGYEEFRNRQERLREQQREVVQKHTEERQSEFVKGKSKWKNLLMTIM
jgi:hypothetical protein